MGIKLKTAEAAEYLGESKSALEKHRLNGTGPAFIQHGHGRAVVYDQADLDAYMAGARRTPALRVVDPGDSDDTPKRDDRAWNEGFQTARGSSAPKRMLEGSP